MHAKELFIFIHFCDNSPFFPLSSLALISLNFIAHAYI
jgi:hypothetical protein